VAKKTPEERAAIRAQVEAARDPNKDRTAHEAERGVKKMTLGELADELPTDRSIGDYLKMLHQETDDRGCAIMGGAFVEHCLTTAIRCRIVDPGEEVANAWFKGANAPFRTFSAKIQLGRAIAMYGPQMHAQLSAIKDIRNTFAHRALPLEFSNPAVAEKMMDIAPFARGGNEHDMKLLFATGCVSIGDALIRDSFEHGGKIMEPTFP
jgi:hypothetical protein